MTRFYDPEISLKKRLIIAEGILNMYGYGCNGSLYFINREKEAEYRTPARDFLTRFEDAPIEYNGHHQTLSDALRLILPMAKAYAAQNDVGSNQEYIKIAENVLNGEQK